MGVYDIQWGKYFEGRFMSRLEGTTPAPWFDAITARFDSSQAEESYKWLGQVPTVQEWIAGRQEKGLISQSYTLANKLWEQTLPFDIDALNRQKYSQINTRIGEMAVRAVQHRAKLMTSVIQANGTCYDGTAFFGASHVEGASGTQDNDIGNSGRWTLSGSATAPAISDVEKAILHVSEHFPSLKDDQGEPMNEGATQFLAMVPNNMRSAFAGAMGSSVIVDGSAGRTNVVPMLSDFNVQVAVNPRLTANGVFYVFRTDGDVAPFIFQIERDFETETFDDSFKNRRVIFGANASYNVGYGYWQYAVKYTFS